MVFIVHGIQSADSIHAINLLTPGLFTVNAMSMPYRNTLTRLCRAAEERYFQELIGDKKASVKMLWEIFVPIVNPCKYKKKSNVEKVFVNGH